jgi:hypothetical protein
VQLPNSAPARPKLPGVIDTLGSGYRTLNRHLYLALIPICLDALYWFGPRLSVQKLARDLTTMIDQSELATASAAGPQTAQSWAQLRDILDAMGKSFNLLSMLSTPLSVPTILSSQDLQFPGWLGAPLMVLLESWGGLLALLLVLFGLGVLLGALYMGLAAQIVRDGRSSLRTLARTIWLYAGRYIALMLVVAILAFFIGFPLLFFVGLMLYVSPLVGSLLLFVVWIALLWVYLFLYFTIDALFISDSGPLKSVLNSITVVRSSTSSALGLFLIMLVISMGMPFVWGALGGSEVTVVLGIIGNAYVGAGLTLASLIFYRDRIQAAVSSQRAVVSG